MWLLMRTSWPFCPSWQNPSNSAKNSDLHKSSFFSGAIYKQLKTPRATVQTTACSINISGRTQSRHRSGKSLELTPGCKIVQLNPETTTEELVKVLEASGAKVCPSIMKWVHDIITTWTTEVLSFWRTKTQLFGCNDQRYVWRKNHRSCEARGWQHHGVSLCWRPSWCTSGNRLHRGEGGSSTNTEAKPQDIRQKVGRN